MRKRSLTAQTKDRSRSPEPRFRLHTAAGALKTRLGPVDIYGLRGVPSAYRTGLRAFWLDNFPASISDGFFAGYISLYILALGGSRNQLGWFASIAGFGIGSFALLLDLLEGENSTQAAAGYTSLLAVAGILGPLVGGWVIDRFGYIWDFSLSGILRLVAALLFLRLLKPFGSHSSKRGPQDTP